MILFLMFLIDFCLSCYLFLQATSSAVKNAEKDTNTIPVFIGIKIMNAASNGDSFARIALTNQLKKDRLKRT